MPNTTVPTRDGHKSEKCSLVHGSSQILAEAVCEVRELVELPWHARNTKFTEDLQLTFLHLPSKCLEDWFMWSELQTPSRKFPLKNAL